MLPKPSKTLHTRPILPAIAPPTAGNARKCCPNPPNRSTPVQSLLRLPRQLTGMLENAAQTLQTAPHPSNPYRDCSSWRECFRMPSKPTKPAKPHASKILARIAPAPSPVPKRAQHSQPRGQTMAASVARERLQQKFTKKKNMFSKIRSAKHQSATTIYNSSVGQLQWVTVLAE